MAKPSGFEQSEIHRIQELDQHQQPQRPLPSLPNELMIHIFSYITDLKTLRNACLATKLLRRIAEPRLYRKLVTGVPTRTTTSYAKNTQTVCEALLTLLRRPELGQGVRKLVAKSHFFPRHSHRRGPEEEALLLQAAEQANIWPDTEWMQQEIEANFSPLYLAILLIQMPHLRELRYVAEYDESGTVAAMVEVASRCLTELATLQIEHWDTEMGFAMSDFGPLLRLPSLRTFKGIYVSKAQLEYQDYETGLWTEREDFPPNSLAIEHLIFRGSALGPWCITTLFTACKTLKTFDYVAGGDNRGYGQFEPSELMAVLPFHKETLERLLLTDLCNACYDVSGMERSTHYALGSLSSFPNLKVLSCEQALLLGVGGCAICRSLGEWESCTHEHDPSSCM